jgi:anti-sigma regulatory factor (Ser/Thr protein kinase)
VAADGGQDLEAFCERLLCSMVEDDTADKEGPLEISLDVRDGTAEVTIRDQGCWRPSSGVHGGHGLPLVQELMESVELTGGPDGTVVRMRRRASGGSEP